MKKTKRNLITCMKTVLQPVVVLSIAVIGITVWYFRPNLELRDISGIIESLDDQRSTLWSLLPALVITMLGSLITTYVFLKGALDRMVDERPYYHKVVEKYRERSMHFFWFYSIVCLALVCVVILLYGGFYFLQVRTSENLRKWLGSLYLICILLSGILLYRCFHIEQGIHKEAGRLRKNLDRQFAKELTDASSEDAILGCQSLVRRDKIHNWSKQMQLDELYKGDWNPFINLFSEWEKFLLLMIDDEKKSPVEQSVSIKKAVRDSENVQEVAQAEEEDARSNVWQNHVYGLLKEKQELLPIKWETFFRIYELLSEYRDLLQVQQDTSWSQKDTGGMDCGMFAVHGVVAFFSVFVMQLSLKYLKSIPRVKVFYPSGRFQYADFYNIRMEDSSFRTSLFENVVFARVKMQNSNLGLSRFERVEFYSADLRNSSWNNCLFHNCHLKESIWNDVDLTGSEFHGGNIQSVTFEYAVLSNMRFENLQLINTVFRNSKLWNVDFCYINDNCLRKCNFSNSDLKDIRFGVRTVPKAVFGIHFPGMEWFHGLDDLLLPGTEKRDLSSLKDISMMEYNPFRPLRICKNSNGRKSYEEWIFWKRVRDACILDMGETVFADAVLSDIRFYRMNFEQSSFDRAQMDGSFLALVNMSGCVMAGVGLREAVLRGCYLGSTVLTGAVLYKMSCYLTNFQESGLADVHASKSEVVCCTFERSDCSRIDLTKASVRFSSFRDGILNGAELTNSEFDDVILDNCIAEGMLSSYTRFCRCSFTNALLRLSSFNYTVFEKSGFRLANFSDSTVSGVEFYECDFEEANFRGTTFIEPVFKNSRNIKREIFENCTLIAPVFRGNDVQWEQEFLKDAKIKVIPDRSGE